MIKITQSTLRKIVCESVRRILMCESQITTDIDKAYMDAVNRGDMKTAQRMVQNASKAAMPNTKLVDENGNLLVVYHGSYEGGFSIFDKSKRGTATNAKSAKKGFFFTDSKKWGEEYARRSANGELYEVYLNMRDPLVVNFEGKNVNADAELNKLINQAKRDGYDGAIAKNLKDGFEVHNQYIVFESNQIKSAAPVTYDGQGNVIPLSERFNINNNDIRYEE